jgi:hypothetical protein
MIEYFIIGILVVLMVGQNIFWANVCLKLTNRLMSRNYGELIQAKNKPTKLQSAPEDMSDPVAERNARDMNSMIGAM